MADAAYSVLCQHNDMYKVATVRTERRRPRTTLMDCILRTPLKSARQSRHNPDTPPSVLPEKKRKTHSASSSLNENVPFEPFGTKLKRRDGPGGSRRSSIVRRVNSEPSSLMQEKNDVLCAASASYEEGGSSPYRPTKRPRVSSLQADVDTGLPMRENDRGEDVGCELHRVHLDEPRFTAGDYDGSKNSQGRCGCRQLIIRMRQSLELERKARRSAEESHLVELQKRLALERLVETLQDRLRASKRD
ncbi:hypothetical protein LshimejAT787_0305740 [Lyophyllum shimeji]|uniref:Uncharacterized protein n=1 Tax=Lyophyllum shimeji TaxID=47721 RepID=A0A9P3PJ03_LYOSH|nr:hypothetical protein LshimejAT787_0305740 [Lyophyllum shimeji]